MTPVLVTPDKNQVYPVELEFIRPQDGSEKQECERHAAKRWVVRCAPRFAPWQATVLTDDLHCHQPFCTLLLENALNFISVCKPDSHPTLYEEIALLERVDGVASVTTRCWNGRFTEQRHYRYVNQVPLRAGADPLRVNWCEVTMHRTDTGERIYYNTFATELRFDARVGRIGCALRSCSLEDRKRERQRAQELWLPS